MEAHDQEEAGEKGPSSVIGADIRITGNIEATVDLLIEGKVEGDVKCQTLLLGEESEIKGNINAERVRVSGSVMGSIETRDLAIEVTGNVVGDVTYTRLKVSPGGALEGNMKCKREPDQKLKLVEPDSHEQRQAIE